MPVDIRVSVIPGDKFCGTEGIFGLNTRNVQSGIFDRTGSKNNDVIELPKFVEMYISAVIDVADKPDITTIHNSVQRIDNAYKDQKSTRLNSSHVAISYAVFCLKKKKRKEREHNTNTMQTMMEITF